MKKCILVIGLLFLWGAAFAQPLFRPETGVFIPKWTGDQKVTQFMNPKAQAPAPAFEGCTYDYQIINLPFYEARIPITGNGDWALNVGEGLFDETSTQYFQYTYRPPFAKPFENNQEWYPAQPVVLGEEAVIQKKRYRVLRIYPIQVHRSGKMMRKYERVNYQLTPVVGKSNKTSGAHVYAANSVLSSGEWYKIAIKSDGVYRIDKNILNQLGVNVNGLDPRTIRVFGNGGAMLPQDTRKPRHDDLKENPIFVEGESDGVFNDGDYVLFFGQGPHIVYYDTAKTKSYLRHQKHTYSDVAYYFINVGQTNGLRMTAAPNNPVGQWNASTRSLAWQNEDKINLIKSGRLWVGDEFDFQTSRNYTFDVPDLTEGDTVRLRIRALARAGFGTTFTIKESGRTVGTIPLNDVAVTCSWCAYADITLREFKIPNRLITDGRVDLEVIYNKNGVSAGWLDYIEVDYISKLQLSGNDKTVYLLGNATQGVRLTGGDQSVQIWDVTSPVAPRRQTYEYAADGLKFGAKCDSIKKYYAFRPGAVKTPETVGRVTNQNLHALPFAEYLMVVHPDFIPQAQRLADFHRNTYQRTVHIVTPSDIYNEFSSGAQDVTAIRDFVKMFYDRADKDTFNFPKYLLLFGDGSYDPKGITAGGTYILSYEAYESLSPPSAYTSDDYYGFLDDGEGRWWENVRYEDQTGSDTHYLDIGIGRFPAHSTETANIFVDKAIAYATDPAMFGDWRNRILLVGDYKAGEPNHISEADELDGIIKQQSPCSNVEKVYLDSYPAENSAEGMRFPLGKQALIDQILLGSIIVDYTGHGGETGLSNASILETPDIQALSNKNKLGFWITATCEFGRYDDPDRTTGAEYLVSNPNGGAIGMLTSVREVFSQGNKAYNQNVMRNYLKRKKNGQRLSMGEIQMAAKNATWGNVINTRNFVLLGDPALAINSPQYSAVVTDINNKIVDPLRVDTLKALSHVTIKGEVKKDTTLLSNFNGTAYITVFDKPRKMTTLQAKIKYWLQNNVIFKGSATVTGGRFSFQFVVPLDISYEIGKGKISLYVTNELNDGGGCNNDVVVCCTDPNAASLPQNPPHVEIRLNNENWISGSLTNQTPLLLAKLTDNLGINTSGLGIGRELTGIIDGDENKPIILNDFYNAKKDSYKEGTIQYRLRDIPDGEHSIRVKAWNVINLSGADETRFIVASDAKLALEHVFNYPNPFTSSTRFFFNHNKAGEKLDVAITIYTVSGRPVKSFRESIFTQSNVCDVIEWDGLDEYGDKIGRGVYVYEIKVKEPKTGESVTEYEKLVVLK